MAIEQIGIPSQDQIAAAQEMEAWFPDYLYGVMDQPSTMPILAIARLRRQFGEGDSVAQIERIRDSLMVFDEPHQINLGLYFCGYPDEILDLLLLDEEVSMAQSLCEIDKLYVPPSQQPRRVVAIDAHLDQMASYERVSSHALDVSGIDIPEWTTDALCAQTDPEAFFPEKGGSTRDAKRICAECDVRDLCLQYALGRDERFGIWGGLSERERRRLKRKRTNGSLSS